MLATSTRLSLKTTRILVADDSEHSLELMTQVLAGFRVGRVKACLSADEAREELGATPFDLIILDCEMPGQGGVELTREIRRQQDAPNFTSPVLLVSGSTPLAKVLRARDAGANMVVKKPIAPAVLLDRIVWLARKPRQFVTTPDYCGPDRRIRNEVLPSGISERRAEAIALQATPDRAMSQDEVSALFG